MALAFAVAAVGVVATLAVRVRLFAFANRISDRLNHRVGKFAVNRFQVFIDGLGPICNLRRLPVITIWSLLVWFVELGVYMAVNRAFGAGLSIPDCVLFMVAVNFSSLVPSAPGAIGVIEAVASKALTTIGVAPALALSMVVAQHVIQFCVVGLSGSSGYAHLAHAHPGNRNA